MPRKPTKTITNPHQSLFEQIRRTNDTGNEYWSSRDLAKVLDYSDYRNFEQVIAKARTACFNSGQKRDDHIVDVTDMIETGKGAKREVKTAFLSRYACYLIVQNADPGKEIVALGQTCFAVQTRTSATEQGWILSSRVTRSTRQPLRRRSGVSARQVKRTGGQPTRCHAVNCRWSVQMPHSAGFVGNLTQQANSNLISSDSPLGFTTCHSRGSNRESSL
jgi:BRO family, N-terminal domain